MLFINKEQKVGFIGKLKYLCKTLQVIDNKAILKHLDNKLE